MIRDDTAGRPAGHRDGEFRHRHSHAGASRHPGGSHLLFVDGLSVSFDLYDPDAPYFSAPRRRVEVLRDLTLSVHAGEVLAVVGASGSGKTVLADALLGIFEPNALVTGRIWFDGSPQDAAGLARLRGRGISLVPQSVTHLDPLMRVGAQVVGGHPRAERERRRARMRELFAAYGLPASVERMYPHELSGGMARRVLLTCALVDAPRLIVADEPTPGLDMDLAVRALGDLRSFADGGGGVLLTTHDLELALRVADRVAVFRDGTVVEETAASSFAAPGLLRDPFSRALWYAMPRHGMDAAAAEAAFDGGGFAAGTAHAGVGPSGTARDGGDRAAGAACADDGRFPGPAAPVPMRGGIAGGPAASGLNGSEAMGDGPRGA